MSATRLHRFSSSYARKWFSDGVWRVCSGRESLVDRNALEGMERMMSHVRCENEGVEVEGDVDYDITLFSDIKKIV
jgi:hypothetical protein